MKKEKSMKVEKKEKSHEKSMGSKKMGKDCDMPSRMMKEKKSKR
jgi:hypothetical protein